MDADWAGVLISLIALVVAFVSLLKSWSDGKQASRIAAAAELTARANEALAEEARKANEREAARMKLPDRPAAVTRPPPVSDLTCRKCGTRISPNVQFCTSCGEYLGEKTGMFSIGPRPTGTTGGYGIPSQSAPPTSRVPASPSAQGDGHASVTIEKGKGQAYVLRNDGDQALTGVTVHTDHPAELTRNLPMDQRLAPGQGSAFLVAGSLQAPLPVDVLVTWDGQLNGQHVELPD